MGGPLPGPHSPSLLTPQITLGHPMLADKGAIGQAAPHHPHHQFCHLRGHHVPLLPHVTLNEWLRAPGLGCRSSPRRETALLLQVRILEAETEHWLWPAFLSEFSFAVSQADVNGARSQSQHQDPHTSGFNFQSQKARRGWLLPEGQRWGPPGAHSPALHTTYKILPELPTVRYKRSPS